MHEAPCKGPFTSDLEEYRWSKAEREQLDEGAAGGDCTSSVLQRGQRLRVVTSNGFSYLHFWKVSFLLLCVWLLLLLGAFLCPSSTVPGTIVLISLFKLRFASERSQ